VFERCFIAWMQSLCGAFEGLQVALDGKTARRSKSPGQKAIHRVSAFVHGLGLTLRQVKTAEKSNEITAIPELLEALLLKGCIVTIDAMGCQKAIAAKIIQQQSDYALLVKNNQPGLTATIEGFFEAAARTGYQGVPTPAPNGSTRTMGALRHGVASSRTICVAWRVSSTGPELRH